MLHPLVSYLDYPLVSSFHGSLVYFETRWLGEEREDRHVSLEITGLGRGIIDGVRSILDCASFLSHAECALR